jgi:rhodanese-related sulfurtransferase
MKLTRSALVLTCVLAAFLNVMLAGAAETPAQKPSASAAKPFKNVGAEEFDKLRQNKTNVVLDVRTPKEYAAGHIPGAVLIDFNSPDFEKEIARLDKNKTYLVHCQGGVRSAKACGKLEKLDFPHLYNLEGGMKAWEKAKKPIEK